MDVVCICERFNSTLQSNKVFRFSQNELIEPQKQRFTVLHFDTANIYKRVVIFNWYLYEGIDGFIARQLRANERSLLHINIYIGIYTFYTMSHRLWHKASLWKGYSRISSWRTTVSSHKYYPKMWSHEALHRYSKYAVYVYDSIKIDLTLWLYFVQQHFASDFIIIITSDGQIKTNNEHAIANIQYKCVICIVYVDITVLCEKFCHSFRWFRNVQNERTMMVDMVTGRHSKDIRFFSPSFSSSYLLFVAPNFEPIHFTASFRIHPYNILQFSIHEILAVSKAQLQLYIELYVP